MSKPKSVIVVPGHAAFKASVVEPPIQLENDKNWALQPFQKGEPRFYIEHIKTAVGLLKSQTHSVLLFSGGRTRHEAGKWSEAQTYNQIAKAYKYWGGDSSTTAARIALEEYARDSLENLQFSLALFHQLTGQKPLHITVVGWEFKRGRFDFHRQTLGIEVADFSYIGCNNPEDLKAALDGEARVVAQFKADPFGEKPPLSLKRKERDPFKQSIPYK